MLTTTDRRVQLCTERSYQLDRIAFWRKQRRAICGLSCCNDADKAEEFDALIRRALENVAECEDLICERSP